MSKVKFNVNTEYAYLQNFKVLQSTIYTSLLPALKSMDSTNYDQTPSSATR